MPRSPLLVALAIALSSAVGFASASAETCTRETLRRVVDEAGARLRVITAETQPRILSALRKLKEKRGWDGPEGDEKASAAMSDTRTADFDSKVATLLARIDELSEGGGSGDPDCSSLTELEATSLELQATIKAKAQYILSRIEQATADAGPAKTGTATPSPAPQAQLPQARRPASAPSANGPKPAPDKPPVPKPEAPLRRADATPPPAPGSARQVNKAPDETHRSPSGAALPSPPPPPAKPAPHPKTAWTTETSERAPAPPPVPPAPPGGRALGTPPVAHAELPPVTQEPSQGFSRDEIREASRGFFGTISGGLANVMEHAFSTLGRPTAYVLGNEGGGAFIAGLRYGKGTLFLRDGSKRTVYWHGPSIGYDFGASGSKTLFLVYNLANAIDIFSGYSGVDGSAYLVGGVGMTVLTDGKVVMAPIRSGLGVRLGANIGYVRFTARPTWNPF
ncbi:MAG: EipA family protein [Hyphomicrobiaceae bacterium]